MQCEQRFPLFPTDHLFPVGTLTGNIGNVCFSSRLGDIFASFFRFVVGVEPGAVDDHRMEDQEQFPHAGALGGHPA